LEDFYERQKNLLYHRPDVRAAKAEEEHIKETQDESMSENADSGQSPSKAKVSFGINDALDINTLKELRKVFFQPEDSDEEDGNGRKAGAGDGDENIDGDEGDNDQEEDKKATPSPVGTAYDNQYDGPQEDGDPLDSHNSAEHEDDEMDNWESRDLDLDEFIAEFGHIIGPNLSRLELQTMFMKIDADSNGGVDWEEFTTWMLKMEAGSHAMDGEQELGELVPLIAQHGENATLHRGMINKIMPVKVRLEKERSNERRLEGSHSSIPPTKDH